MNRCLSVSYLTFKNDGYLHCHAPRPTSPLSKDQSKPLGLNQDSQIVQWTGCESTGSLKRNTHDCRTKKMPGLGGGIKGYAYCRVHVGSVGEWMRVVSWTSVYATATT
jgi:hypothetical protein